jgi:MFS family permease
LIPLAGGPHPLVLATLFLAEVGSGIGVILLDINLASIFAAHIPPELRARVSGAYTMINYGVRPVGSLLGGALGTLIGVRPTLWLAAAGGLAGIPWSQGEGPFADDALFCQEHRGTLSALLPRDSLSEGLATATWPSE